jgi:hypothetical protein
MSLYVGPGSKFHGATFSGGVPLMLKRCVLLKRGRNRPAAGLASRQDVCYEVAGTASSKHPGHAIELSLGGTNAGQGARKPGRSTSDNRGLAVVFQL